MDLRTLHSFVVVAELGNVTRAAEQLSIVQSALSRKIQQLESELGTTLFLRLQRGIQLTPAGRVFLEHAKKVIRQLEFAYDEVNEQQRSVKGSVTLGLSPTLTPLLAPSCYAQLRQDFPDIRLKIVEGFSGTLMDNLIIGRIDLAVLTNPPKTEALRALPVLSEPIVVVTRSGQRGIKPFFTVKELCCTPLILTSGLRAVVNEQLRTVGASLSPMNEIDSAEAIRRIVLGGGVVTLMPVSTYQADFQAGTLTACPVIDATLHRFLVIAQRSGESSSPAVEQVSRSLVREFSSMAESGVFSLP